MIVYKSDTQHLSNLFGLTHFGPKAAMSGVSVPHQELYALII